MMPKVGQLVKWKNKYPGGDMIVEGVVREVYESTFGSKIKAPAVRVQLLAGQKYMKSYPNRVRTTIAVHNLIEEPFLLNQYE